MNPISEKYKVGLTITTNGRVDFLKQAAASLKEMVIDHWNFDFKCVIDDSGDQINFHKTREFLPDFTYIRNIENIGLAQSVSTIWGSVPSDIQYIFHVEDDFTYNSIPRLDKMVEILNRNDNLWQIFLKRQPVNADEEAVFGFINQKPNEYYENLDTQLDEMWLEQQLFFSLNPSIIPRRVYRDIGWPEGNEAEMTQKMKEAGCWSAILGTRNSEPDIHHIGTYRSGSWKL